MLDNKKNLFIGFMGILLSLLVIGALSIQVGQVFADPNEELTISAKPTTIADDVCALIYKGQFNDARQLLKQNSNNPDGKIDSLSGVIEKYEAIDESRHQSYAKSYQEQIDELEKLQAGPFDVNDPNYIFDPNNVHKVLAAINKACEYANPEQKKAVLEKPFVKRTLEKVINIASDYEAKGKWLDAYTVCYSWLVAIYEDNKSYDDYAEKLIEKATIVASFQDSPCETSKERYEGIDKSIFLKAINALNFNYVKPVDYHKMAIKAIIRCELLAEVLKVSPELAQSVRVEKSLPGSENEILDANSKTESAIVENPSFIPPDSKLLSVWLNSLLSVQGEIEQLPVINKEKFIDIFEKVLALNSTTAKLPEEILISQFAEAALASLDPHTVIVWPRQVQDFDKIMTNAFTGIGVEISKEKGQLTISSLLPDTPAYKSGLDAQDVIVKVDGVDTKDMSLICAVKNITGPKGTPVTLTIKRIGEAENFDITIVRDRIIVDTIRGWQRKQTGDWHYFVDEINKIGYVRITSFSEQTASDFEKVLKQLESEGLSGLVLDLRFNGGGLLTSAIEIVDMFVSKGLIVRTQPRFGIPSYAYADSSDTHPDYPIVILVNSYSASASEIVSGALQDEKYKRAIIVGDRTYGKGSVQGITQYSNGGLAQLKYTMAYYHLPSGQRVESKEEMEEKGREDWGITPDVEVKLKSNELKAMFDARRDNDVLVKEGHNDEDIPVKKHSIQDMLDADPQLAIGVLVVKSKLIQSGNYISTNSSKEISPTLKNEDNGQAPKIILKGQGTGFAVSENGFVCTNYHVVSGGNILTVYFPLNDSTYKANIVEKDTTNDLVILRLEDFPNEKHKNFKIPYKIRSSSTVELATRTFAIGYPLGGILGLSPKFSEGSISSIKGMQDDINKFQISNPIQPGNSGGPLFDKEGNIIGVIISAANDEYFFKKGGFVPQNVNFAIKSDYLMILLKSLDIDPNEKEEQSGLTDSIEDKVKAIKPYIVIIQTYVAE